MSKPVCLTVDVEDWYDGMRELGHDVPRRKAGAGGVGTLAGLLDERRGLGHGVLTLFVVGAHARAVSEELTGLATDGHEIASHGPDHGSLPEDPVELETWLRRGRETIEDLLQVPVTGFRSPRFDLPRSMPLERYRELTARAGFSYVSDRSVLGPRSAVKELPVLAWRGFPIGGGSYQRLLPTRLVEAAVERAAPPVVLYYHSYDFGAEIPVPSQIRSAAVAKQVAMRRRIPELFANLLSLYGSQTCRDATARV